jgi:hypothetical protein
MIQRTTRPLSVEEQRSIKWGLPFLRTRTRRRDIAAGRAEVLEFPVVHAWTLITCSGPPCCPNSWLLQSSPDEFVYLESWDVANAVEGHFPGDHVRVSCLQASRRLLDFSVSGRLVPVDEQIVDESLLPLLPQTGVECRVFRSEELPEQLLAALHAV